VLVLGKAGSAGTATGVLPVLREGFVVATVRPVGRKEAATAVVGDRGWIFARRGHRLMGPTATDPAEVERLQAERTSFRHDRWAVASTAAIGGIS
jgi:hypothetical protein